MPRVRNNQLLDAEYRCFFCTCYRHPLLVLTPRNPSTPLQFTITQARVLVRLRNICSPKVIVLSWLCVLCRKCINPKPWLLITPTACLLHHATRNTDPEGRTGVENHIHLVFLHGKSMTRPLISDIHSNASPAMEQRVDPRGNLRWRPSRQVNPISRERRV